MPRRPLNSARNARNALARQLAGLRIRPNRPSGPTTAFRNLPRNVVRHMVQHMSAQTAARFAAASKEYSANARARARAATNAKRAGIQTGVDRVARGFEGLLVYAMKYIKTRPRGSKLDIYRTIPGAGRVRVITPAFGFITLEVQGVGYTDIVFSARNLSRPLKLDSPPFEFYDSAYYRRTTGPSPTIPAARKWLLNTAMRRAIDLYNARLRSATP